MVGSGAFEAVARGAVTLVFVKAKSYVWKKFRIPRSFGQGERGNKAQAVLNCHELLILTLTKLFNIVLLDHQWGLHF